MHDKLYAPFLEATRNVFQLMLDLSDIDDRPAEDAPQGETLDIAIGVTGDLTGEVIYRFPHPTSLKMVAIMSGMEMESVDDFVASAIAEIANIVSGNVMTLLAENQQVCNILPPQLRKPGETPASPGNGRCIHTTVGDLVLVISLTA